MNFLRFLKIKDASLWLALGALVLVSVSGTAGYYLGVREPREVTVKEFSNLEPTEAKPINFGLFWEVWDKLKTGHIDGEKAEPQKMLYSALTGLVSSLGDPNTNFLPPAESKKFLEDVSGRFGGIGAELGTKDGLLVIIAPLKESPAEKIGLQAGDKILKINDKDATGLDVQEAVKTIRGPIGTKVTLNIFREGWKAPRDFTITRAEIVIPTVDWEMKEGDLAYFRIHSFNGTMLSQFYKALFGAANRGGNGIILDLRNNPGGFLEVSVEMANLFLDNGTEVVSEQFRSGEKRILKTTGSGALKNIPMVILINGGSASASEILAGAMRDQRGIKLVGEKSFGKGTVQELVELSDSSQLKLTIARWVTPKGTIIDKNGLKPDVEVKISEKDIEMKKDPQLEKALEILRGEVAALANKL